MSVKLTKQEQRKILSEIMHDQLQDDAEMYEEMSWYYSDDDYSCDFDD